MNTRRNRSILPWLAALAILWGGLAPAIASSLQAHSGKTWVEVCMSVGTKLVALNVDDGGDTKASHPGMHCPACASQHHLAVAAHPPGTLLLADGALARNVFFHHAAPPPAAAARASHRSRAPPLAA